MNYEILTHCLFPSIIVARGIVKKLFETVKSWAKNFEAENIELMTLGENTEARRLYASLGMKESKVQYILEDI